MFGDRPLALLLVDTVTLADCPAVRDPLLGVTVTQLCVLEADHESVPPPVFVTVYVLLDGLNGPPCCPDELSQSDGDTDMFGCVVTDNETPRLVFPKPFVLLVKDTVSE